MLSGCFDIPETEREPDPTGCCYMFIEAQRRGTDSEGYGPLVDWRAKDEYHPEDGWYVGCDLLKINYCPWCGSPVPEKPARFS